MGRRRRPSRMMVSGNPLQASSRRSAAECTVARFMLPSYMPPASSWLWPSADAPPRGNGLLVEADRHPTPPLQPYRGVPVARASQSALLEARRGADVLSHGPDRGPEWRPPLAVVVGKRAGRRQVIEAPRGLIQPPRKHSSASPRSRPTALCQTVVADVRVAPWFGPWATRFSR